MEDIWEKRDKTRRFATGLYNVRLPDGSPALMRRREVRLGNLKDNRLLRREIDYLEESKLLKARASQLMTHPIIGSLHHELVHIAITDENYVSGKETGLGRIPRRQLR
jgi:hypothetical protein